MVTYPHARLGRADELEVVAVICGYYDGARAQLVVVRQQEVLGRVGTHNLHQIRAVGWYTSSSTGVEVVVWWHRATCSQLIQA